MTAIDSGRHRSSNQTSFWQAVRKRKTIDLVTGKDASIPYRLVLRNESDDSILGFRVRLLPGEMDRIEGIATQCVLDKCRKDGVNYLLKNWYVSAVVEIREAQSETSLPSGVAPL